MRHFLLLAILLPRAVCALAIDAASARIKTVGGQYQDGWNLWSNGEIGDFFEFNSAGQYALEVEAKGSPVADEWPIMTLFVDGEPLDSIEVKSAAWNIFSIAFNAEPGHRRVTVMFTNDLMTKNEDRNLYVKRIAVKSAAGNGDMALGNEATWRAAWTAAQERDEEQSLAEAEINIEKIRKQDSRVIVLDAEGNPVEGAAIAIQQKNHEFLFGCNIYAFDRFADEAENEQYKRLFANVFNYATVGFYWRSYEPERGKPNYPYTDKVVEWCQARGIRMKGHPLLWDHEAGIPAWYDGQPPPDIQRKRVSEIMGRYRGKIEFWEVVNEPAHLPGLKIGDPYRWAREADPAAHLIVNDYHVLADGCPPFFELLRDAANDGVPFDGIGIQAHEPRTMRFPLMFVRRTLDHYATLGKTLHITEFTPATNGEEITGSHVAGAWTEKTQAEYAVKFYILCFAHPAVMAITWWDLCDSHSWLTGGGLVRKDLTPKPAYVALRALIHDKWTTSETGKTDKNGAFAFRGFHGTYGVSAQWNGKEAAAEFVLSADRPAAVELKFQQ